MSSAPLRLVERAVLVLVHPGPQTSMLNAIIDWAPGTAPQAGKAQIYRSPSPASSRRSASGMSAKPGWLSSMSGRRGLRLEIAPALKRPHRPRRDRDHRAVKPQLAAADPVRVHERLDPEHPLAGADLALDHPIERTAFENVRRPLRRHPGDVRVASEARRGAWPRLIRAAIHSRRSASEFRADAELDQVQGHAASLAQSAEPAEARATAVHRLQRFDATGRGPNLVTIGRRRIS